VTIGLTLKLYIRFYFNRNNFKNFVGIETTYGGEFVSQKNALVPDTMENMKQCVCGTCPTFKQSPLNSGFFCAKEKQKKKSSWVHMRQMSIVCQVQIESWLLLSKVEFGTKFFRKF